MHVVGAMVSSSFQVEKRLESVEIEQRKLCRRLGFEANPKEDQESTVRICLLMGAIVYICQYF